MPFVLVAVTIGSAIANSGAPDGTCNSPVASGTSNRDNVLLQSKTVTSKVQTHKAAFDTYCSTEPLDCPCGENQIAGPVPGKNGCPECSPCMDVPEGCEAKLPECAFTCPEGYWMLYGRPDGTGCGECLSCFNYPSCPKVSCRCSGNMVPKMKTDPLTGCETCGGCGCSPDPPQCDCGVEKDDSGCDICSACVAAGRPFSTSEGHLLSTIEWKSNSTSEWVPKDWNHAWTTMHHDVARIGEAYWLKAGAHEHASVASFARASLDLMRFGAPPDLLRDTHQAAMEEVKHAEISLGLASSFKANSDGLVVSEFPLHNVELSESLDEFASKLLTEGCIGETSAVAKLTYAIAHIETASPVAKHLIQLRDEEAGHAALAWKSLVWAVSQGAKVPLLPEPQQVEHPSTAASNIEALSWAGVVPDEVADQIDRSVLTAVKPWMSALQSKIDFPKVSAALLPVPIADAVMKGASKVQDRLEQVHI